MTQESENRRLAAGLLNRVSTFRSRPSSRSSSSQKSFNSSSKHNSPPLSMDPKLDRFEFFTFLPLELQSHILTFLPSKTLHKTMGRTNRFYKDLVESYVRRKILTLMSPGPWDVRSTADYHKTQFKRMPDNVLVFEAQRPIDTLTTKHTLYFSHFSRSKRDEDASIHGSGGSTLVHFSFVPVMLDHTRSESADSMKTSSDGSGRSRNSSISQSSPLLPGARPSLPSTLGQRHFPIVHEQDRERLFQRTVTSSVSAPSRSGTSTPRASNSNRRRPFTDVSGPMEYRQTSVIPTRLEIGEEEMPVQTDVPLAATATRETTTMLAGAVRGRGYEGHDSSAPQLTGHWSEPIASSSAAYEHNRTESGGDPSQEKALSRQFKKPTYRFQLDPLDSFETWILSLTLQRKSEMRSSSSSAAGARSSSRSRVRPLRWVKQVAGGLDRVFREWFNPISEVEVGGSSWTLGATDSALHRASLIASMGSGHSSSMPNTMQLSMSGSTQAEEEWQEGPDPEPKMLEFDGSSCTMMIQPHPIAASSHPALTSMSSHHYLSNSSLSSQYHASLTSRVEFTFHCESLTINAARLLGVLEDVERDVEEASAVARQRGAHIVAGSSGGTTWAYSTGGSTYATSDNTTSSRWNSDGPGGVSVLVFGAARD